MVHKRDGRVGDAGRETSDVAQCAALFFDVDGTLIWRDISNVPEGGTFADLKPSQGVYEAFDRLHDRGHLTFLCTGRSLPLVSDKIMGLGFTGCISGGGSCVTVGDSIVHESVIERELAVELASRIFEAGFTVFFESRETPAILSSSGDHPDVFPQIPLVRTLDELRVVAPDMRFCKFEQLEMFGGPSVLDDGRMADMIRNHFDVYDMGLSTEMVPKGVTKASGIACALRHVGHGFENTFAFGDSENDVPMFEAVQTAVAMGNSLPAAIERADYVTSHVKDDGVPAALRHFGLI